MYKNLVCGINTLIPIANGNKVPCINFDNAATTPPFFSVMNMVNSFSPPIILPSIEEQVINPYYHLKYMSRLEKLYWIL